MQAQCVCDCVSVSNLLTKLSQGRPEGVHLLRVVTQWFSQIAGEAGVGSEQPAPVEGVLPVAGGWNKMLFKVLSNPNHSVIL